MMNRTCPLLITVGDNQRSTQNDRSEVYLPTAAYVRLRSDGLTVECDGDKCMKCHGFRIDNEFCVPANSLTDSQIFVSIFYSKRFFILAIFRFLLDTGNYLDLQSEFFFYLQSQKFLILAKTLRIHCLEESCDFHGLFRALLIVLIYDLVNSFRFNQFILLFLYRI